MDFAEPRENDVDYPEGWAVERWQEHRASRLPHDPWVLRQVELADPDLFDLYTFDDFSELGLRDYRVLVWAAGMGSQLREELREELVAWGGRLDTLSAERGGRRESHLLETLRQLESTVDLAVEEAGLDVLTDPHYAMEFLRERLLVVPREGGIGRSELVKLLDTEASHASLTARFTRILADHPERVTAVAQVVSYLRPVMKPVNVLGWFDTARVELQDKTPREVLDRDVAEFLERVLPAAAGERRLH